MHDEQMQHTYSEHFMKVGHLLLCSALQRGHHALKSITAVVADGNSSDGTVKAAQRAGAQVEIISSSLDQVRVFLLLYILWDRGVNMS